MFGAGWGAAKPHPEIRSSLKLFRLFMAPPLAAPAGGAGLTGLLGLRTPIYSRRRACKWVGDKGQDTRKLEIRTTDNST